MFNLYSIPQTPTSGGSYLFTGACAGSERLFVVLAYNEDGVTFRPLSTFTPSTLPSFPFRFLSKNPLFCAVFLIFGIAGSSLQASNPQLPNPLANVATVNFNTGPPEPPQITAAYPSRTGSNSGHGMTIEVHLPLLYHSFPSCSACPPLLLSFPSLSRPCKPLFLLLFLSFI